MIKKIYISGAISDDPQHEIKFSKAEELFKRNWEVINPVKIGHDMINNAGRVLTYNDFLIEDLKQLFECDAIYMLKGWEASKGARAEHATAAAMNLKIYYQN